VQLVSKTSNLCDPDPPMSQTDGQTDGRHAISIPRYALVHRVVKTRLAGVALVPFGGDEKSALNQHYQTGAADGSVLHLYKLYRVVSSTIGLLSDSYATVCVSEHGLLTNETSVS